MNKSFRADENLGPAFDSILLPILISIATAIYGGLHLCAWNSYFRTPEERNWWRVASILIAFSGSVFSLTGIPLSRSSPLDASWWGRWIVRPFALTCKIFMGCLAVILGAM